jgi:CheY-like chemotaxis protein
MTERSSLAGATTTNINAPLILIIEDDPLAQEVISRRLTAAGYRVMAESDGGAGIWRARTEQPALIICDLHMPLAPGELVILGLRTDPATAHLPILVVSADPSRLGPEHRVDGVLTKPVRAAELLATIERIIGAHRTGTRS